MQCRVLRWACQPHGELGEEAKLVNQRSTPAVGIDLGTTNSVLAYRDATGRPTTVLNAEGDLTTPSVVYFHPSAVVVGKEAAKMALFEPHRVAQYAKRDIGSQSYHRRVCGQHLPPEVVEALVLQKVVADARPRLGDVGQGGRYRASLLQ